MSYSILPQTRVLCIPKDRQFQNMLWRISVYITVYMLVSCLENRTCTGQPKKNSQVYCNCCYNELFQVGSEQICVYEIEAVTVTRRLFQRYLYVHMNFGCCLYVKMNFGWSLFVNMNFRCCLYVNMNLGWCLYVNMNFGWCLFVNMNFGCCLYVNINF